MLMRRKLILQIASFFTLALSSMLASDVLAMAPPARAAIDANGVDLLTGRMTSAYAGPLIGSGHSGLAFVRNFRGTAYWDSYLGTITSDATTYLVTLGATTEKFAAAGDTFTPLESNGASLTLSGGVYTYTTRSGTIATFELRAADFAYPAANRGSLSTLTYPSGERVIAEYHSETICVTFSAMYGGCTNWRTAVRIASLTSTFGYRLAVAYAANSSPHTVDPNLFVLPARITLSNLADGTTGGSVSITRSAGNGVQSMELIDDLGRVTKYTIADGLGITGIRKPGSAVDNVTVTYLTGRVSSINRDGLVTYYGYPSGGARVLTFPGGAQQILTFDVTKERLLSYRDQLSRTTLYEYDEHGRLARVSAPEGNSVQYTYDLRGNVTRVVRRGKPGSGLSDIVTSAGFDAECLNAKTCNQPGWTRDAKGNQTDFVYDPTHGSVTRVTLPAPVSGAANPTIYFSYTPLQAWYRNPAGELMASGHAVHLLTAISSCRSLTACPGSADESQVVIGYGPAGVPNNLLPRTMTMSDGSGTLAQSLGAQYDSAGNVIALDGPLPGSSDTIRTHYDTLRRVVGTVGPDPDGTGSRSPIAIRYGYDTAGRLLSIERGTVASQSDPHWPAFAPAEAVSFVYDTAGRRTQRRLTSGGVTFSVQQNSYDALGRLQCVATRMNPGGFASLPGSACTLGSAGVFGSDRISRLTYDAADRLTAVTTGVATATPITAVTATYTANGRVQTVADGKGNLTTFEYDGFDRPFRTLYPSSATPGTSSASDLEERTYDANSNVTSFRMRNGESLSFVLDNLNRVILKDLPGSSAEDVHFRYDNHSRLLAATYGSPAGSGLFFTYDALGRLSARTVRASSDRRLTYAYDAAGRRTRITYPDGFHANYAYNAAGELTAITDSSGTTLATYVYDSLGRPGRLGRANGSVTDVGFDAVSRLNVLTHDLSGSGFDGTSTFAHSPSGQLARRTQSNDAAYTWLPGATTTASMTHNGANQLTKADSIPIAHDTLANLESGDGAFTFGYDLQNQLRSAIAGNATVSLDYDPSGMLSSITSDGSLVQFLYDGPDLLAEYDSSGNVLRRYVHGAGFDEPLVSYEGSGTTSRRYLHADERGSIVALSNDSGAGITSLKYSPDGESANAAASRFGYTGQVWLSELGLYYYKARMYSPRLGRFLQPDPTGYGDGLNLYAYVRGDPINLVDPSGLESSALILIRAVDPSGATQHPGVLEASQRALVVENRSRLPRVVATGSGSEDPFRDDPRIRASYWFDAAVFGLGWALIALDVMNSFVSPTPDVGIIGATMVGSTRGTGVGVAAESRAVVTYYPATGGFIGATSNRTLFPGTVIDRYGGNAVSRFFSPVGTPIAARSLPPGTAAQGLRTFEVVRPFSVEAGRVAPAFGNLGLGVQYRSSVPLSELLEQGFIRELIP